jgi:hypothetical protein
MRNAGIKIKMKCGFLIRINGMDFAFIETFTFSRLLLSLLLQMGSETFSVNNIELGGS